MEVKKENAFAGPFSSSVEDDEGSILPLLIGMLALLVLLAGGVVDLSYAYLSQRALYQLADSAAVAAVTQIDAAAYYSSGAVTAVPTSNHYAIVSNVIRTSELANTAIDDIYLSDGQLFLTLSHRVQLPWPFLVDAVTVRAEAAAQARVSDEFSIPPSG